MKRNATFWEKIKYSVFNSCWWRKIWYEQISSRFRPRNKWMTALIPRTWCDKDHLLETVILGSLKHYVEPEGEDCFNVIVTDHESCRDFYQELRHNYELAIQKLGSLEKELDAAWDAVPNRDLEDINNSKPGDCDRIYGDVNRLEKEIYDLQTEIMVWVVKNRNKLWT